MNIPLIDGPNAEHQHRNIQPQNIFRQIRYFVYERKTEAQLNLVQSPSTFTSSLSPEHPKPAYPTHQAVEIHLVASSVYIHASQLCILFFH
mmetsp:Transcript_29123/g.59278  ORF Transcript_29123/g.59278 Transcript_29123/m.59278 type:complete len:91 (-) Transcript_29123:138-410(-)